ncbi:hypothetical protein [Amycolatopsis sp. NBC_01480]|jgi:hypothetical protein|uniref:hypothetical protein n=1 Tax=Amycolatopsis sp. NBC_01480 TaxID=2903562 RepID=UPI002E286C5B|nr:hypothetical protein [Amycolatopsis sp. NBC_01480]
MHFEELFEAYAEFTTSTELSAPAAGSHTVSRNTATPGFLYHSAEAGPEATNE